MKDRHNSMCRETHQHIELHELRRYGDVYRIVFYSITPAT